MVKIMDESQENSKDLVQLARLALAGRPQDVQTYILRMTRKYQQKLPDLAGPTGAANPGCPDPAISASQRNRGCDPRGYGHPPATASARGGCRRGARTNLVGGPTAADGSASS